MSKFTSKDLDEQYYDHYLKRHVVGISGGHLVCETCKRRW